jgi:FMN phosphatase YigB (HAD superfamily)
LISSITFDVARTLVYLEGPLYNYRALSEFLVENNIELYPQELEAARNYVFFYDLPNLSIDNWFDWSNQILIRLGYNDVEPDIIDGVTRIFKPVSDRFKLYDDVAPTIKLLKEKNLILSALTTIPEFKLIDAMKPIRSDLEFILHAGNTGYVKGNPKMYKLDLDKKAVQPENNIFIGDDEYLDIEIPRTMGQYTIQIEREKDIIWSKYSNFQVKTLTEVPKIIESLEV